MQQSSSPRFEQAQVNRTLVHPTLPQPQAASGDSTMTNSGTGESPSVSWADVATSEHCFVVAADTQFGMTADNLNWDIEVEYSRRAVAAMNAMQPRPLFCCICGDLVDMTANIFAGRPKVFDPSQTWTAEECDLLQERQFQDVKRTWSDLHPEIALVCLCGNHDVGNRPTASTVQRFTSAFGDDYLAFWANGTYNIVVNSALFSDPSDATDLYSAQLEWLEQRLRYARCCGARNIFVFSHHPWFLYDEDEEPKDLTGSSPLPNWNTSVPDSYFPIPQPYRQAALDLFRTYGVSAAFSGHFHQNVVSKASFGMEMIVTGSLSMVLESSGNPNSQEEPKSQGFRLVHVRHDIPGGPSKFRHSFVEL
jgi:serine/threonine-protein phosphatase CPPED1